ncbi:MAG: hypothetical protein OEM21_09050 [Nitrosopumilus sp.]|nr:hypothetical protein [Nitrosopumilus sp.]
MKLMFLWLSILVVAGVTGAAALTNTIEVNSEGIGVFGWKVICLNNGGGYFCNATDEIGETSLVAYEDPDIAGDDFSSGVFGSLEGCSPSYWESVGALDQNENWPVGYLPDDKFSSPAYFNKLIAISSGTDPTLQEALQSQGDGINKLTRHSVAALLNAANPEINYPMTIIDIISYTQTSIDTQNYSFADVLASSNNVGKATFCEKVE